MSDDSTTPTTDFPYKRGVMLDLSLTPDLAPCFAVAAKAARAYSSTIMLLGESGVGKTRLAQHIHDSSPRSGHLFKVIDLSQATPSLFESEFYGHEKGSFTGALSQHKSPFEEANGGTVFLDEIGDLSFELQARLLRLVQEKKFKRVGGSKDIEVDVRIIAATSRNLEDMVAQEKFREDLYHRLNVVQLHVPPLRDRKNDIIPLAGYFLELASKQDQLPVKTLSDGAKQSMLAHSWPGNVRALENAMKRATIMSSGDVIEASDLSLCSLHNSQANGQANGQATQKYIDEVAEQKTFQKIDDLHADAMRFLLASTLEENSFSKERTARMLRTNANTMSSRILTYLRAEKGGVDAVKTAVDQWNEDKMTLPHLEFLERLYAAVKDINQTENRLTAVDDIFYQAKIIAIKEALIESDFVQAYAATALGIHGTTVAKFVAENPALKTWLDNERATRNPSALELKP